MSKEQKNRNNKILTEIKSGTTFEEIGNKFGITKQRVNQISKKYNIHRQDEERKFCEDRRTDIF